jgi:hypothetical protein
MRVLKAFSNGLMNLVYKFFALEPEALVSQPIPEVQVARKPSFYLKTGKVRAFGEYNVHSKTFTVHAGSEISKESLNSDFKYYVISGNSFRELASYVPSDNKNNVVLIKDYVFASPGAAASICGGNSANGLDVWIHMEQDKTLKEIVIAERDTGV